MEIKINKELAQKVLSIVDKGLVKGLGQQEEGKMCIEAAVCYALGLPHGDNPPCVGNLVRQFKISLNDCEWSSNEARTKGMRELSVAQLGSNEIDQNQFLELVGFECITKILPVIIKNGMEEDKDNEFCEDVNKKLAVILKEFKSIKTYNQAKEIASKVWEIYVSASAFAYAYAYAYASASAYAYAYASAFAYAYASASAYAYAYASAYAFAYASAYAFAYASAKKNPIFNDKILNMTAQAGLRALKKLKSPGTKYLNLCE